jgi:hypothetical protein
VNIESIRGVLGIDDSLDSYLANLEARIERYEDALREIVRREARSEYSSLAAAPSELARIAHDALR